MSEPLPEWVTRFILPLFLSFLIGVLSQVIIWFVDRYQQKRAQQRAADPVSDRDRSSRGGYHGHVVFRDEV